MTEHSLADRIVATLHPYATQLRAEVAHLAAGTRGKVKDHAWRNAEGIVLVYVSYDPNGKADETSVEAICTLHVQETYVTFAADVENQDGEVLESLISEVLIPIEENITLATVDSLGRRAYEGFLNFFQMFLESHTL